MANHVLNGVMGLCVADALGVPAEFVDRAILKQNPVVSMRAYGTYNQPVGTWSDDTSMTICLVDSLTKRLDYSSIMLKFTKWFNEGEYTPHGEAFDIGITTSEALIRFKSGVYPLECGGKSEHDNGNGSLMRILPILFYLQSIYGTGLNEIDEAFEVIHNVSALTHGHERSQMACGIYISVASELIEERNLEAAVYSGIHSAMNYYRRQAGFEDELKHFKRLEKKDFKKLPSESIRSSGYVVDTLEAAIWCLLNTGNYRDCVLNAVNLGGDTDTVGAVA
ncbi:MAG: ADP-ribosylglycohydrolase family protein [Caldicoprobacterales bacterium]